jgi:uncharacterized protein YybS (DUF2232 family)
MGADQIVFGFIGMILNIALPVIFFTAGWIDDRRRGIAVAAIALGLIVILAGPAGAIQVLAMFALPAALITGFGLRSRTDAKDKIHWYPADRLVWILILYVSAVFVMPTLWLAAQGKSLQSMMTDLFRQELERSGMIEQMATTEGQAETILANLDQWLLLAPSVTGICLMVFIGLAAWIGHKIARRFNWTSRPNLAVGRITLPLWYLGLTALFALAGLYGTGEFLGLADYDFLFGNLALIMVFGLYLAGLVYGHKLIRHYGFGNIALVLFYTLFLLPGWPMMVMTAIGGLDQLDFWRDWTLRSKSATNDNKD